MDIETLTEERKRKCMIASRNNGNEATDEDGVAYMQAGMMWVF
jgi:hypothetical protein